MSQILTKAQQKLLTVWEDHMRYEFETHDLESTMTTMANGAHLNNVPVMTGGVGLTEIRQFYGEYFIPDLPPDTETVLVSRTISDTQIVDELIFKFTHTIKMSWMLPGIEPTGKHVEIPLIVIIRFNDDKVQHEHIYWDQASVLVQVGLLDKKGLPILGVETAEKIENPNSHPSNQLINHS